MKRHLRAKKINELIVDFLEIQDSKKNEFDSFDQLWKEVVGDVVSFKTKSIIYKKYLNLRHFEKFYHYH